MPDFELSFSFLLKNCDFTVQGGNGDVSAVELQGLAYIGAKITGDPEHFGELSQAAGGEWVEPLVAAEKGAALLVDAVLQSQKLVGAPFIPPTPQVWE